MISAQRISGKLKMDLCCRLGAEFNQKKNVLYETDNFFVVPTIGQIGIEGYLLLCSKEHFMGVGGLPQKLHKELEETLTETRNVLSEIYKTDVLVFEHGPRVGCYRGGGCLDHSHLHIVPSHAQLVEPLALNLLRGLAINDYYKLERVSSFKRLKDVYESQLASYMFVETPDLKRYLTEVNFPVPSQYLRQIIARQTNRFNKWDWRLSPDIKTFEKTLRNLQGKFE